MKSLMRPGWLAFLALTGCVHLPAMQGTPKHHVQIHVNADVPIDAATVAGWVDRRVDEWIAHKKDWGCDQWSDAELEAMCQKEPIIVYSGYFLDKKNTGAKDSKQYIGWNFYDILDPYINVTIDFPAARTFLQWDPDYVNHAPQDDPLFSFGVRELPHEWTHTARGAWHP